MFKITRKLKKMPGNSNSTQEGKVASLEGGSVDKNLREQIVGALRGVYDPEIPVNIYDLGLVYGIDIDELGRVEIRMTLTAPACPVAGTMPRIVEQTVLKLQGVREVRAVLVWDPPWSKEQMSEDARLALGLM
jgi:FeS assembly SUF system protein